MRMFFILFAVLMAGFTVWCGFSHQPIETKLINLASTMLSLYLAFTCRKKES